MIPGLCCVGVGADRRVSHAASKEARPKNNRPGFHAILTECHYHAGIRTASEIEQLCHLCQLDYGRCTAVLAADDRYMQAASQAAMGLIPATLRPDPDTRNTSRAGVALHSDQPSDMLLFLTMVRAPPQDDTVQLAYPGTHNQA